MVIKKIVGGGKDQILKCLQAKLKSLHLALAMGSQ